MPGTKSKISQVPFEAVTGILLGFAIILAVARTYIRVRKFRRLFPDDGMLFLAVITLVAGTAMMYMNIPWAYLQVNVELGVEAPPPNFVQDLIRDERTQDAAAVLLETCVYCVKLSFMFFFWSLLRRVSKPIIYWWWCILAVMVPSAAYCICANFVACPVFGSAVLLACVTPEALARQNAVLIANATLDAATDVLLISIPVLLLWRVRISLRQKLSLGALMSLSVFMVIISIIKVSAGDFINGQVDSTWALFWLQVEAEVAVIVVSVTAFRALFVPGPPNPANSPYQRPSPYFKPWNRKVDPHYELPSMPSATFTGVRSFIRSSPYDTTERVGSEATQHPSGYSSIKVTNDISTEMDEPKNRAERSHESFV